MRSILSAVILFNSFLSCYPFAITFQSPQRVETKLATINENPASRRSFLITNIATATALTLPQSKAVAETVPTSDAKITDKIFFDLKGLSDTTGDFSRITIGLFGDDVPQPVSILKQLSSPSGYFSKCKPLDTTRALQREQLEANKVYNACTEAQDRIGVSYDLSTVWRIVKDRRIDVGAVLGKFVARENPNFEGGKVFAHDAPGVVSVRRGDDGGFGFTIFPGGDPQELDEGNIVVGRVLEGMDVVRLMNEAPVVQSSKVNYMGLTGGALGKNEPTRACRYGGAMYCNEMKPLKKIQVVKVGVL